MSSGMNLEQAKELASQKTYRWAINNIVTGRGIKYRKATMIKLRELAEIADRLDAGDVTLMVKSKPCNSCAYNGEPWYSDVCDGCCGAHSNYKPKE